MAPVGLTKDTGWQIGLRRTLPTTPEAVWALLFSEPGLRTWLGELPGFELKEGAAFELSDGTKGKFTTVKTGSHVRLQWYPLGYPRYSIMQVRVLPAANGRTTISFHQEHLPDERAREKRREFFAGAMKALERLVV